MENFSKPAEKITVEEPGLDLVELYDDMPPASTARPNAFGTLVTSLLLREVSETLKEINKILAVLDEVERQTAPRQTVSGELIPSNLAEGFVQMLRRSGVEETVREQLTRLQAGAFKANLETTLNQYWFSLRERSNALKERLAQATQPKPTQPAPEAYVAQEPAQAQNTEAAKSSARWNWGRPTEQKQVQPQAERDNEIEPSDGPGRDLAVDIFDEPLRGEIVVVAEHAGLLPDSVWARVDHDILNLTATDTNGQSYHKEFLLPAPVEPASLRQQYRNGVLELRFKKA